MNHIGKRRRILKRESISMTAGIVRVRRVFGCPLAGAPIDRNSLGERRGRFIKYDFLALTILYFLRF